MHRPILYKTVKYDYVPRPLIEDHYSIRALIEAQEKRAEDREYHKNRIKQAEEIEKDIKDAPMKQTLPFYCNKCKEDFIGEAIKQVDSWSAIAFYKTKCFKGHWCIRHVTDRLKDAYFFNSKRVAIDRMKHHTDLLQSFETNYNLMYGK